MTGTSINRIFYILLLIPLVLLLSIVWIVDIDKNGIVFIDNDDIDDQCTEPCIPGNESIMKQKAHGTSNTSGVQNNLKWNCDIIIADRICNYNRQYAEYSGYWEYSTTFLNDINSTTNISEDNPIIFYDSNTGKEVFRTPIGRTWDDFIYESEHHGWPSFRDQEVTKIKKTHPHFVFFLLLLCCRDVSHFSPSLNLCFFGSSHLYDP